MSAGSEALRSLRFLCGAPNCAAKAMIALGARRERHSADPQIDQPGAHGPRVKGPPATTPGPAKRSAGLSSVSLVAARHVVETASVSAGKARAAGRLAWIYLRAAHPRRIARHET